MQISEITLTVGKNGKLKVPVSLLKVMGLGPGDHIRVAYLTNDGTTNIFKEFLLAPEEIPDYTDEQRIVIPLRLLQQAQISPDSDIQIICLDGALIIGTESELNINELKAVLEGISAAVDVTDNLPSDTVSLCAQLQNTIEDLREEYES